MAENNSSSLDAIRDLLKAGAYEQAHDDLETYLHSHPDDAEALALQHHLDNLGVLRQIHRSRLKQDWDQVIQRIEAAIELGLTWDIDLHPLAKLLENAQQGRAEAARHKAQSLLRRGQEAEERQELDQAHELYAQAFAIPHLDRSFKSRIKRRMNVLRPDKHATVITTPAMLKPDALVEQLVVMILKKSRPQVAEAVRLCAVPYWFDLELLRALRDSDDGLDEKILKRMDRFSFIHQDDRGRYTFSEDVRHYLLDEWGGDPAGFVQVNRRAQACCLQKLKAVSPDSDLADALPQPEQEILTRALAEASPEVSEMIQHYLYHTLVVDAEASIVLLRRLFHAADEAYRLALAESYLAVANEQRAWLDPGQRAYVDYMRGLLDQLYGKWEASRDLFEHMLSREGLSSTLQARIRRALGYSLSEQEQWVEAIELFESALQDFQADGDALESALTMVYLGQAHLDLALNTWGGGATFELRQTWSGRARNLITLVSRSPVTLYLMFHLGVRALLPVILRVGRDMNWVVARLFVIAAGWFKRADAILRQLDDKEGLGRVEESLAWLYLLLGHFGQAEAIYHRLLAREGTTVGEYRATRARLGLAQVFIQQGRLEQARELLQQILPIFVAYQHEERVAQTHTALAQTFALQGQPTRAVTHYQQAAQLYRQIGAEGDATEVVEQMQLLQELPQTDEDTRQSIETTASQITHRYYLTRFSPPLLYVFRLLALVGLTGVLFFSLFTSIHIESGTDFGVSEALLGSRQVFTPSLEPVIEFELVPRLQPSSGVDFTLYLIVVLVALYLALYTILGLWLTIRTSLCTLQEGQRFDITVDPVGIGRGVPGLPGHLKIKWEQVVALLLADRGVLRKPIALFSRFALFSKRGAIVIDGQTRRYLAVCDLIQRRLDQRVDQSIPVHQFGFNILYSRSGWLFVGTLTFILAFVITARVAPQVLTTTLSPLPYSLTDLYSISYLGLLLPPGWWLGVQPLRERLFLKPETGRVWGTGLVGLLLAALTFLDLGWLRLSIGRPNVAPGLLAALLVGLAAYYVAITRHWEHMPFRRGEHVYSLPVRLLSGAIALVIILLALGFVGREISAYHYLALANLNRQRAAEEQEEVQAQALYEQALSFYDRALDWVGNDADTYHSRGATLVQLGRYDEAVGSILKAINLNAGKSAYYNSLAITYEIWAKAQQEAGEFERALEHYELARDNYTFVIEQGQQDRAALVTTYLSRAGACAQMGEFYRRQSQQAYAAGNLSLAAENRQVAVENYQAARADYGRVTNLDDALPSEVQAAALSGLGWMEHHLAKLEQDVEQSRAGLGTALDYFEQAAELDRQQLSAWSGQGYTHFAIGETYTWEEGARTRPACAASDLNPRTVEEKRVYQEENLAAIAAFERATNLIPENASLQSVQGYLYFNLLNCPDVNNADLYLAAIEGFSRALELEPGNLEWRLRRANLYYVLIEYYDQDYYAQAIADYEVLVSAQPRAGWYEILAQYYYAQGNRDETVQAYTSAVELEPDNYKWQWLLGWYAYENGDYQLSVEASQAATALNPTEPRTIFNQGLALAAMGEVAEAERVYAQGITVTNALVDQRIALARYDEAIGDLSSATQAPPGITDTLSARLTFEKALIYVESGSAQEALATYQEGIAIVNRLDNRERRRALYDQAIQDLQACEAVAELVTGMVELLQTARDG